MQEEGETDLSTSLAEKDLAGEIGVEKDQEQSKYTSAESDQSKVTTEQIPKEHVSNEKVHEGHDEAAEEALSVLEDSESTSEAPDLKLQKSNGEKPLTHRRNDSVPLKRYELDSPLPDGLDSHAGSRDQSHLGLHFSPAMERQESSYSETVDAGLDFVDIRLDQVDSERISPYASLGAQASRSAVEIRQDSISSDSQAAKRAALEAEERERAKEYRLHRRDRTNSEDNSSTSSHSSRRSGRSVEGRYMGRRSRQTSRAASPVHEREEDEAKEKAILASPFSLSIPFEGYTEALKMPIENGLMMSVADADGEITMVTPTESVPRATSPDGSASKEVHNDAESRQTKPKDLEASSDIKELAQEDFATKGEEQSPTNDSPANTEKTPSTTAETRASSEEVASKKAINGHNDLKDVADKEITKDDVKKRRESTHKPSALEQHMSRTRMMTLPPKSKQEDVKHLHDYEEMMKLSREKEVKKQLDVEEKKRQKDVELQEDMKIWEKDILPSWTRARREVKLRKLWSKGIPSSIRGRLWAMACGNNQMLPRNLFSKASAEAKKKLKEDTFPIGDLQALREDIEGTLPSLKLFQKGIGPLHEDLFDVLTAFVIVRMDQEAKRTSLDKGKEKERRLDDGTIHVYHMGTASIAAMLLTNLTSSETMIAICNLIVERPWLRALYSVPHPLGSKQQESAAGFERVFDTLLADQMPKVYANMQARGVRPSGFVTAWVRRLFVPYLPFDLVARLWDCILLDEGDAFIYRIAIAIFSLLSARLYVPDKAELLSILKGNNKAALSVWYRTRASIVNGLASPLPTSPGANPFDESRKRLSASSISVEASDDLVPIDDIYGGQYNINEGNMFDVLDDQSTWWKDSILERLLDRELMT